ncbi:MAG TPA: sulfurtransferase [Methanobacterium sp.]|nr:sulfurtransferase [Methanobacterium sp.]
MKWVSSEWLAENIDMKIMILDVQPDIHDYIKEHIPGAYYLNEWFFREMQNNDPAMYVPPEVVQILFRKLGIRKDVKTIVYTGRGSFSKKGDGWGQTMAAYSLVRFGHENVYILDGGIEKWKDEERELTKIFPYVDESKFDVELRKNYYIEYSEFKRIKDNEDVVVLDARPFKYYSGPSMWNKHGHIPGARSLQSATLMNRNNRQLMKPVAEIESMVQERGATPDKTVICYCGTGREATNLFLVFKWYLGYPDVKIYEGSITEWTQRDDNPTIKGPNPY